MMQVFDTITISRAWLIKDWFAEDTNGPESDFGAVLFCWCRFA